MDLPAAGRRGHQRVVPAALPGPEAERCLAGSPLDRLSLVFAIVLGEVFLKEEVNAKVIVDGALMAAEGPLNRLAPVKSNREGAGGFQGGDLPQTSLGGRTGGYQPAHRPTYSSCLPHDH